MTDPYSRLLELARLGSECAATGDWEALERVEAEQAELRATLPATPPARARPLLEQAVELVAATARIVEQELVGVRAELVGLNRGRAALVGYGGPGAPAAELDWQG